MCPRPVGAPAPEAAVAKLLRSPWLLFAAAGVVIGILILLSKSLSSNRFEFQGVSRVVEIEASRRASHVIGLNLPKGTELRLSGSHLENRPPELVGVGDPYGGLRIVAESLVLDGIAIDDGSVLALGSMPDGSLDLRIAKGGAIRLTLSGRIRRIGPDGNASDIVTAQRPFGLDVSPSGATAPARVVFPAGAALNGFALYDQPIQSFSVTRPRSITDDARLPFQSELSSGKLTLLDTGAVYPLEARSLIWLTRVEATVGRVELTPEGLAVDAIGTAERIGIGPPRPDTPPRPDRDVTPSIFAFLVGQHELKLAWGTAAGILAALWKARQWAVARSPERVPAPNDSAHT